MDDLNREVLKPDVVIVGGGPAGLTAARQLSPRLDGEVLVLDRESEAGGIPRHSDHTGYGIRDLHRMMTGPKYARKLRQMAADAGARIETNATVTGWAGANSVEVTSPSGLKIIEARAIVLATGARERPRPARRIPGGRPPNVFTTGQLQNYVHLNGGKLSGRAVVVGAELVSWSSVMTLRHAGAKTVMMTSAYPSPESYAAFNIPGKALLGVEARTRTRVTKVIGHRELQGVEIENLATGAREVVPCDVLVFTGDWIPDNELARTIGLDIDPDSLAPITDTRLVTSRAGIFAAGNLLHPVDTADIAALDGSHVAASVLSFLSNAEALRPRSVRIRASEPFRWIAPGILREGDGAPARDRFLLWTDELVRFPRIRVMQDGAAIGSGRVPWPASPGRVFRLPASLLSRVDFGGGDVFVRLA